MLALSMAFSSAFVASPYAHVRSPLVARSSPPTAFFDAGGLHDLRAPLVARSAPPVAFDTGSLSIDELKGLLKHRGVNADSVEDESALAELLRASEPTSAGELSFSPSEAYRVEVFERVSPSVAFIQSSLVKDSMLPFGPSEYPLGAGSGFVWDDEGHIVTNYHVVSGSPSGMPGRGRKMPRKVRVSLQGSAEQVEATVVGFEADKDLAVLKVDPKLLPSKPLEVARSAALRVGQDVLAIGNPFGLDYTLTTGVVSALGRDINGYGGRPIKDCVQTDASINPGNSGGPLLDSNGRLIGVNTMIYAPNGIGANVGIGFAIPSDTVARVVQQIITLGNNARPSLGASLLSDRMRNQLAKYLNTQLDGALLTDVVRGSPAEELKLAPVQRGTGGVVLLGDLITSVDGRPVKQNEDLLCALEESEPGQPVTLTVVRGCDPKRVETLEITPVARNQLAD